MRWTVTVVTALAAASPAIVAAQTSAVAVPGGFPIAPGQQIELRIDGPTTVTGVARAAMSTSDRENARQLLALPVPDAPVAQAEAGESAGEAPPPAPPGRVVVRLFALGERGTMLSLQNGYGRAIRYRARMRTGGRTEPTDVCVVIPAKPTYEFWPFAIDRLELSDFAFTAWKEGDPVTCA